MGAKPSSFKKKLLASSISSCLLAAASVGVGAQEDAKVVEEVIVRGIRSSIETSINIKRDATTVVDSIVAEDIGKLPDVTISDSLQRISGVQIRRVAGEGAQVNIRGLPQVVSQLNGEQYLGASSITTPEPNFGDIPSQLFKGADVYKSSEAALGMAGISGTIDLKTYRPFDFDDGLSANASVEVQSGEETGEADPVVSGLVNWKSDRVGVLLAGSYGNVNLANYYNGLATHSPFGDLSITRYNAADSISWTGEPDPDYNWISPQGISAWNQVTERERLGLNGSLQFDIGAGFELIADVFYTKQEEYNRKVGFNMTNKWSEFNDWVTPVSGQQTGLYKNGREWITYSEADFFVKRVLSYAQNDFYDNESTNFNLELNYDNGGAFTGGVRVVLAEATSDLRHGYIQGDLTDGTATLGRTTGFFPAEYCEPGDEVIGAEGGCLKAVNPNGYTERPTLTVNTQGEHMSIGGFDNVVDTRMVDGQSVDYTMRDYMTNLNSYVVGAYSGENNEDKKATMDIARADGSYAFEGSFVTSVDFGVRLSKREIENRRFHFFSPFYDSGCQVQWKATDVALGTTTPDPATGEACTAGENLADGGEFEPYIALPPTSLGDNGVTPIFVSDFGPVRGIPGVWAADPAAMDDLEAFHTRVFGSVIEAEIPGRTYEVESEERMVYVQANFEKDAWSGNLGVRVIQTDLRIKQNLAGASRPYGDTNFDIGDVITEPDYTDVLPALNLSYDLNDSMKLRFAAAKTMTPLDMQMLADGLVVSTSYLPPPRDAFVVNSAQFLGNPELDPWRANNYDLTYEWYTGAASMVSFGLFRVDIESFPAGGKTVAVELPDSDGVVNTHNAAITTQGEGGQIEGFEFVVKQSFADLDIEELENFGVEFNYTKSKSEQPRLDVYGAKLPFDDHSENQMNFIGYYENGGFQLRVAYNYRDDRLAEIGNAADHGGLALFQKPTTYVDVSASYDINEALTLYLNGSNVTGEYEDYYIQWPNQYAFQNYYEPRYTLGVRARF